MPVPHLRRLGGADDAGRVVEQELAEQRANPRIDRSEGTIITGARSDVAARWGLGERLRPSALKALLDSMGRLQVPGSVHLLPPDVLALQDTPPGQAAIRTLVDDAAVPGVSAEAAVALAHLSGCAASAATVQWLLHLLQARVAAARLVAAFWAAGETWLELTPPAQKAGLERHAFMTHQQHGDTWWFHQQFACVAARGWGQMEGGRCEDRAGAGGRGGWGRHGYLGPSCLLACRVRARPACVRVWARAAMCVRGPLRVHGVCVCVSVCVCVCVCVVRACGMSARVVLGCVCVCCVSACARWASASVLA
jgi:hypothetical protein